MNPRATRVHGSVTTTNPGGLGTATWDWDFEADVPPPAP
jgi:hypothetical protein